MAAVRTKHLLKSALYRTIGETVALLRRSDDRPERTLRVLMYHKVNDVPHSSATVPTALFDEQMGVLRDLGYTVVDLEAVLAHYLGGQPLPSRAVLITFDDAYRDNLENALPVLQRHGYGAVLFAPVGYVGARVPLPHDEPAAREGVRHPVVDWNELRALDRAGVRVESHGVSHVPLARLPADVAAREIAEAKRRLEDELGRRVRAFAFVKGSKADFGPEHLDMLRSAGYDLGFTTVSGANGPGTDRFQLHRYAVEAYSARTFELVLRGACDAIRFKDTVGGTKARRALNAILGTGSK